MSDVQRIDVVPPIQAGLMFHLINDELLMGHILNSLLFRSRDCSNTINL